MPLKPYSPALLDPELAAAVAHMPPVDNSDVAQARQGIEMMHQFMPPVDTSGVTVTDRTIPGPNDNEIRVRVYQPDAAPRPAPAMVFYHWGGFMLGNLETEHARCVMIARDAACVVVSVDYRLAPEHPFPAGPEDCYAGLVWTAANAADLSVDPVRIAVGGTSAGGGLAAAVSLMSRDRGGPAIALQFMGFPVTDDRMETASVRAFTDTPNWTYPATVNMWRYYLGDNHDGPAHPYAAPIRADDLSGLPPAYIWTGEFDPLRDEGIAYALRLMSAGVPVELHNYAGAFHGFDQTPGAAIARRSQREQVAVIRAALGEAPAAEEEASAAFGHMMVHVTDVAATVAWYQQVFGLAVRFAAPGNTYAEMATGTTTLAFSAEPTEREKYGEFTPNTPDALPAGFHLALQVADLDTVYERALKAGAVSIHPPQPQPWGAPVARVRDLNGVLVAIGAA